MNSFTRAMIVSTLVAGAASANAQSLFDSTGGNYNWANPIAGMQTNNPTSTESWVDRQLAFQFTSNASAVLGQVDLAVRYQGGNSGLGSLSIYTDNGNGVGTLLGTTNFTPSASGSTGAAALATGDFGGLGINLTAGSKYWLSASPAADQTADWLFTDITTTSVSSLNRGGTWLAAETWRPSVGMKVNAVPEPASMAALGIGLAALIRRRKKNS